MKITFTKTAYEIHKSMHKVAAFMKDEKKCAKCTEFKAKIAEEETE